MTEPQAPLGAEPPQHWHLFLAAHTNVGKTALLRTLLGQDVGEVADAADVTQHITAHELARDAQGQTLSLWDTPGFGDSHRLAQRLRMRAGWLRWLVCEGWDRWRTPALWRAQRLAQTLKRQADVVLYPVSLLERPQDAVYVAPELEALRWAGKPVLVLLNQGGSLANAAERDARMAQWRALLAEHEIVRAVVDLDAFSRCWLQELSLFKEIGRVLPEASRAAYQALAAHIGQTHLARLAASCEAVVACVLHTAQDRSALDGPKASGLAETLGQLRERLPWGDGSSSKPHSADEAMTALAQRLSQRTQDLAARLIALHRLEGVAVADVMDLSAQAWRVKGPVDTASTSVVGGLVSGLLTGLGADLMAGGLTLGAGALVGGVVGALGAAALTKGYNVITHQDHKVVRWSPQSLEELLTKCVHLYLGVAHFGRGQGPWQQKAAATSWADATEAEMQRHQAALQALWAGADAAQDKPEAWAAWQADLQGLVEAVLRGVLQRLYPGMAGLLSPDTALAAPPTAATMSGHAHLRPD